eukprot:1992157-Amphidinium_carterae.1
MMTETLLQSSSRDDFGLLGPTANNASSVLSKARSCQRFKSHHAFRLDVLDKSFGLFVPRRQDMPFDC